MSGRGINPLWFAYEGGWEWWGVLGFCQRVALSGVILPGRHSGTCTRTRALGRLKCHRGLECCGSGEMGMAAMVRSSGERFRMCSGQL